MSSSVGGLATGVTLVATAPFTEVSVLSLSNSIAAGVAVRAMKPTTDHARVFRDGLVRAERTGWSGCDRSVYSVGRSSRLVAG
jgi:hypothetical protein